MDFRFEVVILPKLEVLRKEIKEEVKLILKDYLVEGNIPKIIKEMKEKLPPTIHVAMCGNCFYNDAIKFFHKENFYPFCECQISSTTDIKKCKKGEKSDEGSPIPKHSKLNGKICEIKTCPPGYRFEVTSNYDLIIFEDNSIFEGKDNKNIRNMKQKFFERLLDCYKMELFRIKTLYSGVGTWIWNTINFNTLKRWCNKMILEDYIYYIQQYITKFLLDGITKSFDDDLKDLEKTINENRKSSQNNRRNLQTHVFTNLNHDTKIKNAYKTLGFTNIENLPSQEEIKTNYKKMSLRMHPDKNPGIDTSKIFNDITEAYNLIKSNR